MKLKLMCDADILFDSTTNMYKAMSIDLTEQVNTTNTLVFTLPPFNPNYDKPQKMTSVIELYRNDALVFEGRVLYTDDDILGNRTFTCEGSLAYFLDSIVRPNTTQDTTIRDYLQGLLNQHNAQVEEQKRFTLGIVNVTNTTDNVYRIDNDYSNTLTVMQEKLVNRLGGYLRVRKENNVRYLDYLEEYGTTSNQTIEFQKNILDLSQRISAENVITALIPLGVKNEETGLPLTIESVNGGKDYLVNETAVSLFGYIYGKNEWEDVTLPENLKTKGEAFLQENIKASWSIEVNAVDLSMLDVSIDTLDLGMSVPVISVPHKLDENFTIKKKETKYLQPQDSEITLDTVIKRNTDQVSSTDRQLGQLETIQTDRFMAIVKEQTNLITGGSGGNMQYGFNDSGLPSEIFFLDNPDKELAKKVLRINQNGIGFSKNGINGPFETAWTLDGVFNANYITAGILQGIQIIADLGMLGGWTMDSTSLSSGSTVGIILDSSEPSIATYHSDTDYIGMKMYNGGLAVYSYANKGTYVGQLSSGADGTVLQGAYGHNLSLGISTDNTNTALDGYLVMNNGEVSCYKTLNMRGHSIINQSDKRLKKNIKDIDCSFVYDLEVKQFDYLNGDKNRIGILANDYTNKGYSKYFLHKGKDGYYGVDYQNIMNALIKCVQEQNNRIKALERGTK